MASRVRLSIYSVPWRCMLPRDALAAIVDGDGGVAFRRQTGADILFSKDTGASSDFSDLIVKMISTEEHLESADRTDPLC